jgi:hypothetical protein
MIYPNANEPLANVFDEVGVGYRQIENLVIKLRPAYQRPVLSIYADQAMGGIRKVKSGQRKYTIFRQEDDYPNFTIQTRQTSGTTTLLLTPAESNFTAIPNAHMLLSKSGAIGKVLSPAGVSPMVVEFFSNPNGNTAFVAADFATGEQARDAGVIGNTQLRDPGTTVFSMPDPYYNVISQYDATCFMTFEEMQSKTEIQNKQGKPYYAFQKDVQTLERLYQQYLVRTYSNVPLNLNSTQPVGASLLNQIMTMGGGQTPLGSTQKFTVGQLRDAIRQYKASGGFTTDEILVVGGSEYVGNWQEALENYVIQSGDRNTIGGDKVVGINVMEYGFQGLRFKVATDAVLDNKNMWGTNANGFSERSNSAIWTAVEKVQTENGGTAPFVCSYYLGETDDIKRTVINGMIDQNGNHVAQGTNNQKGVSIEYTWDKTEQLMNPAACWYHGA